MKIANLTDVKNNLSRYIDQVRKGGRVRILVRGVPAADLVPVSGRVEEGTDRDLNLADLERRGLIRRGRGGVPEELLEPGPESEGKPLSEYVIEERRSGR